MTEQMRNFLDFIDERKVVRRAVLLFIVFYMLPAITWEAFAFARFAVENKMNDIAIGTIVVAVTGPFTFVVTNVVTLYHAARDKE